MSMKEPKDIRDLISRWPSIAAFQQQMGLKYQTARKMHDRNSINPAHWPKLIEIAEVHGVGGVTFEWLSSLRSSENRSGLAA